MATTSIGAPGVIFPDGTTQASSGATGVNAMNVYVSPGTWTKPATVKSIKVTVVGGGGAGAAQGGPVNGGSSGGGGGGASIKIYPAASLPGPQPYTVGTAGNSSSFGVAPATVITATGGATASSNPSGANSGSPGGAGGIGSNGDANMAGGGGVSAANTSSMGGAGGSSIFGGGGQGVSSQSGTNIVGNAGRAYGGGGSGARGSFAVPGPIVGGAGAAGVVIIEEFY